jgi:hypothetical protein
VRLTVPIVCLGNARLWRQELKHGLRGQGRDLVGQPVEGVDCGGIAAEHGQRRDRKVKETK